jgi:MFS superfamily sulfate permease-like transporter
MVVAVFYILRNHYRNAYSLERLSAKGDKPSFKMLLAEEVSFLNKGNILRTLNELPQGSNIVVDGSYTKVIDHDVIDVIRNFMITGARRNITVTPANIPGLTAQKTFDETTAVNGVRQTSEQLKETL